MGDADASSTTGLAARVGLGDHCGGESTCWLSMDRRRTARGGGTGCGRGGDATADKDGSLSPSTMTVTTATS